jgi:multiple sugar transport system ATP-binding protein
MANLSVQHVSNSAVQDFNLEVGDREFLVLAGPPGCGNGPVLRLIAGLDPVSTGDIAIGDKRVNDIGPKDRDIAMIFRNDVLYPRMSVAGNMIFALKLRKFPEAEIKRRIADAASILGIESILDRKPATLSPAERFRGNLARAIVRQPKVFLFDEPLENLGPALRVQFRAEILRLHHRLQATFIYATHDPVEAVTMAQRLVVMKEGTIQQVGAAVQLYREPENIFVATALGSPTMNLIRGKLRESGDGLIFKETDEGVLEIKLPNRPEARDFAGREVIAGVRPEDIQIVSTPPRQGSPRYRALLDVVELTGADALAHIETGAHRLIAITQGTIGSEEAGHRVQFEIDPARVHLFDPETTRRITA